MGDPTARQQEVPQQLRKLVRGTREQCTRVVQVEHGCAREVHEITQWCTRLRSGERWYTSRSSDGQAARSATTVEEACEWCTRAVHESGMKADGAREVHEADGARDVHSVSQA